MSLFFWLRLIRNRAPSQRQANIKLSPRSDSLLLFCLRGSAEECHQNVKAEYDITAATSQCLPCSEEMQRLSLRPLGSPFRLSLPNSGAHSKCEGIWWRVGVFGGGSFLKTLCRVCRQTPIVSCADKSMVVKRAANSSSWPVNP